MAIEILPPQLANQIAAGEVVERPASVVKEIVENSLDAGATRIDIEIEKGGSKLIRIKDNGLGICKHDLSLALSRHATSKVKTLDDLEAIMSFGFRGEALASISSVSRLMLTSKTMDQTEAWQAYAEGSDMAVKLVPAAHPVGTSIEVVDLFFNTPARRRFLKSDKTEFTHIEEWLKRIALIRNDIHITLTHNGKMVKNFRPAKTQSQLLQRLSQVCGRQFADNAVTVNCQHDGMSLSGYLQSSTMDTRVNEIHYFYVNGRLVRDRFVNHAVKQAFFELQHDAQQNYVLMLELDPHQVDVNVHPAKHEVRFHQSRYVHDYILQALQSALSQVNELVLENTDRSVVNIDDNSLTEKQTHYQTELEKKLTSHFDNDKSQTNKIINNYQYADSGKNRKDNSQTKDVRGYKNEKVAAFSYEKLLQTPHLSCQEIKEIGAQNDVIMPPIIDGRFWVIVKNNQLQFLSIEKVSRSLVQHEIECKLVDGLVSQPLLMPVSIDALDDWKNIIDNHAALLNKMGIEIVIRYGQLIVKKVPPYIRDCQLVNVLPELLSWINVDEPNDKAIAEWFSQLDGRKFKPAKDIWQIFQSSNDEIQDKIYKETINLPWQQWVEEYFSE